MGNRQLFPEESAKELLEQFRASGSQEPYEEIVRRYAAMVFGVCLRVTGDKHDAEDATQAVFLSLALQAKTSREITYVGPWLKKVAHRLALDVKKAKTRRKRREEKLADEARHANGNGNGRQYSANGGAFGGGNGHGMNPADAPGAEELKSILMEELNQLPAKYRMPLVMHYFGGLSREEMADQLGCNPSTLGVRVHRGKAMLGTRLAKRGIAISAIAFTVLLEHVVRNMATQPIINTASAAATGLVAGNGMGIAIASAKVIGIVRTAMRSIAFAKLKYAVAVLLVIGSAAFATGGEVIRTIRQHLPSLNLSEWVKPLYKSLVPNLRADAGDQDPLAPLQNVTVIPAPDPSVDLAPMEHPFTRTQMQSIAVSAPPSGATAASVASVKPQANVVQTGDAAAGKVGGEYILPVVVSKPPQSAGPTESIGSESAAEAEKTEVASADAEKKSSSTLYLGAGGGGGFGKPDVYVLPPNATLHTQTQVVGDSGFAVFRQDGGVNRVDGTLTVGKQKGSVGRYEMNAGTLTAAREVIGEYGQGTFIQMSGVNIAQESITIGFSGTGYYEQNGGETIVLSKLAMSGETLGPEKPAGLVLGATPSGKGTFALNDGELAATPQKVGDKGTGTVIQKGGKNTTGAIEIASKPGSTGDYKLEGGKIQLDSTAAQTYSASDATIKIGDEGTGKFTIGNTGRTGQISEDGKGASVVVRGTPTAAGSLVGWGPVLLKGDLVQNGQVVADGMGRERDLNLSSFSRVTSSIENPSVGGTNGWFARREGRLMLPPISVAPGTATYTWGEDDADPVLDLVNSVRFTINNAEQGGPVRIDLLASSRDDIPNLPVGHQFIGVWSFDAFALGGFESVDFTIRYDDALATAMSLDEQLLKLWRFDTVDLQWHRINDDSFFRNEIDHLIGGTASPNTWYVAVSAPEPGSFTLIALGAAALLRRHRRRG